MSDLKIPLVRAVVLILIPLGLPPAPALSSEPIVGATLGPVSTNTSTIGDIWASTWAVDNTLYTVQDDSFFPNLFPDGSMSFLAISRLEGDDPEHLRPMLINRMPEYTKSSEAGTSKGSWKGAGIISIDSTLYVSITQVRFDKMDGATGRIESVDASIIKSKDGGKSWTRSLEANLERPMFPGTRFSNPVFIQFGRNASASAHGSDRYVYAISSEGPWSHADRLILGRVLRSKIGNLDGTDWEFYRGGGRDGMRAREWTHDAQKATPILTDPDNLGWTNVTYLPGARRYLMGQWHWIKGRWHDGDCTWVLREAPTPWGPWAPVVTKVWDMYHDYYFPVIASKFTSADGSRAYVFTAGWYKYNSVIYRLSVIPLYLHTARSLVASTAHLEFRKTAGEANAEPLPVDVTFGDGQPAVGLQVRSAPTWLETWIASNRVVNRVGEGVLSPGMYTGEVIVASGKAQPEFTSYTVSLKVQVPHAALRIDKTKPGIRFQSYESPTWLIDKISEFSKFDLSSNRPNGWGISGLPSSEIGSARTKRLVRFTGYFVAKYPGEYTFYLTSQDGSRLTVARERVVDDDGVHAPYEQSGTIWLQEGLHSFDLDFFQVSEDGHLEIAVRGPGQSRRPLEANDLVHAEP